MPEKQELNRGKNGPDILLGSGSVDPEMLASVIKSFYGGSGLENLEEKSPDRRRYKGKHQNAKDQKKKSSNSPMYIKLKSK